MGSSWLLVVSCWLLVVGVVTSHRKLEKYTSHPQPLRKRSLKTQSINTERGKPLRLSVSARNPHNAFSPQKKQKITKGEAQKLHTAHTQPLRKRSAQKYKEQTQQTHSLCELCAFARN